MSRTWKDVPERVKFARTVHEEPKNYFMKPDTVVNHCDICKSIKEQDSDSFEVVRNVTAIFFAHEQTAIAQLTEMLEEGGFEVKTLEVTGFLGHEDFRVTHKQWTCNNNLDLTKAELAERDNINAAIDGSRAVFANSNVRNPIYRSEMLDYYDTDKFPSYVVDKNQNVFTVIFAKKKGRTKSINWILYRNHLYLHGGKKYFDEFKYEFNKHKSAERKVKHEERVIDEDLCYNDGEPEVNTETNVESS